MKTPLVLHAPLIWRTDVWQISASVGTADGELLCLRWEGRPIVRVTRRTGNLTATVQFTAREEPIVLQGDVTHARRFRLDNTSCRIALFLDDALCDEDWPLGRAALDGVVCTRAPSDAVVTDGGSRTSSPPAVQRIFRGVQGWKPAGHNVHVGDCMPFVHDGVFHLFYLYDRRGHGSKWGLGAHQWAHISSADLMTWQEHPLAIGIDRQEEGSICTGSVIYAQGLYHAFYAVRMSDGSPAQLTRAISTDGIHFKKSRDRFALAAPYDAASARDPKVFAGEDGLFHMLVTTSLWENGRSRGCLAHLCSRDLRRWEPQPPAVVLPTEDQPECSDLFRLGDTYYLLYSNYGVAHYFWSKAPCGPWTAPANNVVVDERYRVPKRAIWWDGRVIFTGFRNDPDVSWGGTVYFYEARPQADGSLTFHNIPELTQVCP